MSLDATDPTWINSPDEATPPLYTAEELRRNMAGLLAPGATVGAGRGGALDPRSMVVSLSGNNVQCAAGPYSVESTSGAYLTGLPTSGTVDPLTPADGNNPRRDRVVLQIQDPDNGSNDASGGSNRRAVVRYLTGTPSPNAGTGVGMPALPNVAEDLAWIDVPKNGSGSPVVTDKRRFSVASGAAIPVRNVAERDALPKYEGAQVIRLDQGSAIETCTGGSWVGASTAYGVVSPNGYSNSGSCIALRAGSRTQITVDIEVKRTGGNVAIGTGWSGLGAILPTAVRGNSITKYWGGWLSGGSNNIPVGLALDPVNGTLSVRGQAAFNWTTNALLTVNMVYYI